MRKRSIHVKRTKQSNASPAATPDALTRERERLAIALHAGHMGVYEWLIGKGAVWWSPELYLLFGVEPDSFAPAMDQVNALIHPDDREERLRKTEDALARGKVLLHEYRIVRPDGEVRWIADHAQVSLDRSGQVDRVTGAIMDITEQKQAKRRLEVLISSIDDHLVTYDTKWRFTFVNEAAARVLGKSREELLGKCIWDLFPHAIGNQYYRELHEAVRKQRPIRSEHYYAPFGKWFENSIYPFEDGVTVFSTDITARKQAEAAFLESQKQKDEFIGIASHELKTPVTSIKAYAQVLQYRFRKGKDKTSAEMFGKMDAQIDKLTNLIADLLDVTKIEQGKLQFREDYFDFNELATEIVEETQRTTDQHNIIMKLGATKTVYGDRERIGQVITNFLTNAIKYSPHADTIILSTTGRRPDGVTKRSVTLSVQDFGVGLSEEDREKVFDRFYRVSGPHQQTYPGLGLGLYISAEIIKRHSGKIWVMSVSGMGSTFYFSLPIRKPR